MASFSSPVCALALATAALVLQAHAATPAGQMAAYAAQSGQVAQTARGQLFFTSQHGNAWSCSSCHTAKPTVNGQHASTGKVIAPLAPAANAERFADAGKTENGSAAIATTCWAANALPVKRPTS